jgi:hypothetical protein
MIGLVLALAVVAVVISLFGGWIFGIGIGAIAIILFVLSLRGFGRRAPQTRGP